MVRNEVFYSICRFLTDQEWRQFTAERLEEQEQCSSTRGQTAN